MTTSWEEWRAKARDFLKKGISPAEADWGSSPSFLEMGLFEFKPLPQPMMPAEFVELSRQVACVRDPDRWALLYRLIYRLNHENKNLLKISIDPDVQKARNWEKAVRRDIHKMHAFVRFKKTEVDGQETYVAWHRPEHLILEEAAPFFVRRFGDKAWSILTPDASAHWDLKELRFREGMPQWNFDVEDPFDEVWKTYYRSIFNPARLKLKAMNAEMPSKYWSSMPEAEIIQELIRETPRRLQDMASAPRDQAKVPANASWEGLRESASLCRACPLAAAATQTVFGEGSLQADLMIVGEQPGDEEDLSGRIFVGPAGKILEDCLASSGIPRDSVYITNAVKHFKWTSSDTKARLHKRASGAEMQACKPWLEAEIARIRPKVIIALGVTAAMALYGRLVKIQAERGKAHKGSPYAPLLFVSWHPAAILRSSSEDESLRRKRELRLDLSQAFAEASRIRAEMEAG